jgi:dienelactone hydrolase
MAEVVLFHHAQGLTSGVIAFADELRANGHTVHTPDLFEGRTFGTLEEGMGHVEKIGFGAVTERGVSAVEFGGWPDGVPVQVHGMDADPIFVDEGDIDAARELVAEAEDGELVLYPGDQHYFADSSLPSYDADATALLTERVLSFLRTR